MRRVLRPIGGPLVVVMLLVVPAADGASGAPARAPGRGAAHPNVVFVLVDDLDATGGPIWKALPETRARRRAWADLPQRVRDRPGLLPGERNDPDRTLPAQHRHLVVVPPVDRACRERHDGCPHAKAGYETAFLGKYLNDYEMAPDRVPPGWDEWFGLAAGFLKGYGYAANHNGAIELFSTRPADYQTDVLARLSTAFVDSAEAERKPFFLFVSPSAPHTPIRPAPRHADNPFADDEPPRRPNRNEADVSDKPSWLREGVRRLDANGLARETRRYRDTMGSLAAVDDLVAGVAQRLRARGALENTVFVFTSDNGLNRGAHRLTEKMRRTRNRSGSRWRSRAPVSRAVRTTASSRTPTSRRPSTSSPAYPSLPMSTDGHSRPAMTSAHGAPVSSWSTTRSS